MDESIHFPIGIQMSMISLGCSGRHQARVWPEHSGDF